MNLSSLSGRFDPYLYLQNMGQFLPPQQPYSPYDIGGLGKPVDPNTWMPPQPKSAIGTVMPPPTPGSYPMGPGTPTPAMPAAGGMDPKMMMAMQMLQGMSQGGGQQAPAMQPPPPVMPQGPGPTVPTPGGNPEPMQRALQALQRLQEARRSGGNQQQRMMPPGMFGM